MVNKWPDSRAINSNLCYAVSRLDNVTTVQVPWDVPEYDTTAGNISENGAHFDETKTLFEGKIYIYYLPKDIRWWQFRILVLKIRLLSRFCKFIFQLLKKIYVLKDFLLFKCLNVRPYDIVVIFPRISTILIQLHLFCIQNVRKQIKRIFPVCLCHANLGE